MRFENRTDAGRRLAKHLSQLHETDVVVLGLPRGGVPVAFEVAMALDAPLDVIVVRKLGVPFQPELAMGAIGEGGVRVSNDDVILRASIGEEEIAEVERRERVDLERQASQFRDGRAPVDLAGRTALIIDDGIATGSTASAACRVARLMGAERVVLAVPVGAPDSVAALRRVCDEVVCLYAPDSFLAVGSWYDDFSHVTDAEVITLLHRAETRSLAAAGAQPPGVAGQPSAAATGGGRAGTAGEAGSAAVRASVPPPAQAQPPRPSQVLRARDERVELLAGGVTLTAHLTIPQAAQGIVVFVHGSGSSRHSPRNRFVGAQLNEAGLGTLLFDLLTSQEELDRANVFDIETLASRLGDVTRWLRSQPGGLHAGLGYVGASTGAAAALWAAAEPDSHIDAIVSRGGRPDLAEPRIGTVRAPTLPIVGDRDEIVLDLNRQAQRLLRCENRLSIIPGATHLFEEPGALETVTRLARGWFSTHFGRPA